MIGETVSHYKIISKLGEGGMGVVYEAEDTRLDRSVALKFLPASLGTQDAAKKRFIQEAKAASSLEHPNICAVYDIGETDDGQMFIAMPRYDGETLQERIARGPLEAGEAIDIVGQLASGLAKAHEQGIVHRDIKPANVFITRDGHVKILDFGLARLATETRLTKSGTTLGTIAYMSPEQASGGDVDTRSDVFSLGVVLYELLTGTLPFKGDHEAAIIYGIMHEDPEPLNVHRDNFPGGIQHIIDKALAKNVRERYQTVDELMADLSEGRRVPAVKTTSNPIRYAVPALVVLIAVLFTIWLNPFRSGPGSGDRLVKLAVLPFENLGRPEDEYFADGITDEIMSKLAMIRQLGVISRTSSVQYKSSDKGLREIGEELGVDYILEGTIRWDRRGERERVRITPQLIDVSQDIHLWAENYERNIEEIFLVQADIATKIAQALNVTVFKDAHQRVQAKPTENLDAYQAYLRGLEYGRDFTEEELRVATNLFERAITLDPEFALAHARLSGIHSLMYHYGHDRTEERLVEAKKAADRALDLQPRLSAAHVAMAFYYYRGYRDYKRALEELVIAEECLPDGARLGTNLTAWILRRQGKFEAAVEYMEQSFELSPRDAALSWNIGLTYDYLRKYETAHRYFERSISLRPDQLWAYIGMAKNHWRWQGDLARARNTLEKVTKSYDSHEFAIAWIQQWLMERDYQAILAFVSSTSDSILWTQVDVVPIALVVGTTRRLMGEPERARNYYESALAELQRETQALPDDHRIHSALGIAYAGLGRRDDAIREGRMGTELMPISKDAVEGAFRLEDLASIYVMVGEEDSAIDEIEHLLSIPCGLSVSILRIDPRWEPLRDHPRFQRLLTDRKSRGP